MKQAKKIVRASAGLFAASLLLFAVSCERGPQGNNNKPENKAEGIAERERNSREKRRERIKKEADKVDGLIQSTPAVAQMVSKYQAVPYWENDVKDGGRVFAVNVQEAIVRADKRPLLLINQIDDLVKEDDKYYLNFESITYTHDIYFRLECDAEQVNKLTGQSSMPDDEYAIIAAITAVRQLRFRIKAAPESEEEANIELDTSGAFTAEGRCLEFVNIGAKSKER
jgi:hypothetical protein